MREEITKKELRELSSALGMDEEIVKPLFKKSGLKDHSEILTLFERESSHNYFSELFNKALEVYEKIPYDSSIKGLMGEIKAAEILAKKFSDFYVILLGGKNTGYDILLIKKDERQKTIRIDVKTFFKFTHTKKEMIGREFGCPTISSESIRNNKYDFIMHLITKEKNLSDLGKEYYVYSLDDTKEWVDKIGTLGSGRTIWKLSNNWKNLNMTEKKRKLLGHFEKYQSLFLGSGNEKGLRKLLNKR